MSVALEVETTTEDWIRARVAPLPAAFLTRVRTTGIDDLGQKVKRLVATGGEPCRDVLRRANAGEELILASFSPIGKPGPFKEYGPVYVLAHDSGERVNREAVKVGSDRDYLRGQFAVRAYSYDEEIIDAALVEAGDGQRVVDEFLGRPDTAFVHVRFPTYGCFALRLDR